MKAPDERDVAHLGDKICHFRAEDIAKSADFRRLYAAAANVVPAAEQPFEHSPDGLIKHLVNRADEHARMLRRRLYAVPAAERPLRSASSHVGRDYLRRRRRRLRSALGFEIRLRRHVTTGIGRPNPSASSGSAATSSTSRPSPSTSISMPTPNGEARLIVISNRIVKSMGFDWLDQLENAPSAGA